MRILKFVSDIQSYGFIAARTAITHDLFPFDFHFLRYAVLRHSTLLTIGRYKGLRYVPLDAGVGNFEGYFLFM